MPMGGVRGDADFPGESEGGIALEGNHIGGGRVRQKIGVEFREGGVGEEDQGEFAGRRTAKKFMGVGVEGVNRANDRAAVEPEVRMAVRDGDGALGHC